MTPPPIPPSICRSRTAPTLPEAARQATAAVPRAHSLTDLPEASLSWAPENLHTQFFLLPAADLGSLCHLRGQLVQLQRRWGLRAMSAQRDASAPRRALASLQAALEAPGGGFRRQMVVVRHDPHAPMCPQGMALVSCMNPARGPMSNEALRVDEVVLSPEIEGSEACAPGGVAWALLAACVPLSRIAHCGGRILMYADLHTAPIYAACHYVDPWTSATGADDAAAIAAARGAASAADALARLELGQ